MNTHDIDIELPAEFRSGNRVPVTVATIKRERMEEILQEAIGAYRKRIAGLEAARFAYASEFPPNEDGDPDVGSIHENIRKLKAELEADRHPTDTQQKLNEVLEYLQNETMKLEAAYGNNFRKEATEKARAATEKMKEAVYAINKSNRKRRGEPGPAFDEHGLQLAKEIRNMLADANMRQWRDEHSEFVLGAIAHYTAAPQPAEPADVDHGETRVNIGLKAKTGCDLGGVVDHGEAEPVKVPSDEEVLKIAIDSGLAFQDSTGKVLCSWREDADISQYLIENARALLTRYTTTKE